MAIRKIESMLLKYYKKISLIILLIILILYILNVNNHYQLFLEEIEKLRDEIESLNRNYQVLDKFTKKVFESSNLIGRKIFIPNKRYIEKNFYKIVGVTQANSSIIANKNLIIIVKNIKNKTLNTEVLVFPNSENANLKNINMRVEEFSPMIKPTIFLLGKNNQILSAFSLDGTESRKELNLISNFLIKIILKKLKEVPK